MSRKTCNHSPNTKALLAVNLLGNPNNFDELLAFCQAHSLLLLEDNCESMDATYEGKMAGTFGVMGTFSTFFSHHISTMEGGVIVTDDEELYHILLSIRSHGWTRHLPKNNLVTDTESNDPFCEISLTNATFHAVILDCWNNNRNSVDRN